MIYVMINDFRNITESRCTVICILLKNGIVQVNIKQSSFKFIIFELEMRFNIVNVLVGHLKHIATPSYVKYAISKNKRQSLLNNNNKTNVFELYTPFWILFLAR